MHYVMKFCNSYRTPNFFGVIVVFNHAVNIVGQLMLVSDVFDAACMNHVSNTFFRAILAGEGDPTWLVIPIL